MKKISFSLILTLIYFASFSQNKIVKGGQNTTVVKTLESFSKVRVDLNADIEIIVGQMPLIELQGPARIIRHISSSVKKNELYLKTEEGYWLQGKRPQIKVHVPFLTSLTTDGSQTGIGQINVTNIDVENFKVQMRFGTIILNGKANKFNLTSSNRSYYKSRGTCDASNFKTMNVDAKIEGSNSATVYVDKNLSVHLKYDASLQYLGSPSNIQLSGQAKKKGDQLIVVKTADLPKKQAKIKKTNGLTYVNLTIKNNSLARRHFIISGPNPSGKTFSYGFPMNPQSKRKEKVPVGTKFFAQSVGVRGKKLLEVTKDFDGQVINLF